MSNEQSLSRFCGGFGSGFLGGGGLIVILIILLLTNLDFDGGCC